MVDYSYYSELLREVFDKRSIEHSLSLLDSSGRVMETRRAVLPKSKQRLGISYLVWRYSPLLRLERIQQSIYLQLTSEMPLNFVRWNGKCQ
jgi:hypothetical protein